MRGSRPPGGSWVLDYTYFHTHLIAPHSLVGINKYLWVSTSIFGYQQVFLGINKYCWVSTSILGYQQVLWVLDYTYFHTHLINPHYLVGINKYFWVSTSIVGTRVHILPQPLDKTSLSCGYQQVLGTCGCRNSTFEHTIPPQSRG